MKSSLTDESPLICNLGALDHAQREHYQATMNQLFGSVEAIEELPGGYAFRLLPEATTILQAAEFITLEQLAALSLILLLSLRGKAVPSG
jgi:hypothetical protein